MYGCFVIAVIFGALDRLSILDTPTIFRDNLDKKRVSFFVKLNWIIWIFKQIKDFIVIIN